MAENIEYWIQKCSICFDARYDFCVEACRDQYCRACFERYIGELLNQAWGMGQCKVKCPVCSELIPEEEWSRVRRNMLCVWFCQLCVFQMRERCFSDF